MAQVLMAHLLMECIMLFNLSWASAQRRGQSGVDVCMLSVSWMIVMRFDFVKQRH